MVEPAKLHEALLKTKIKLASWLDDKLAVLDADYWHNLVVPKVSYNQKLNIDRKRSTKLSQLDLAVLLRVLNKNWDDLSYRFNIEGRIRNYLNELQDIRNRYAHLSDYPSADDFARDVDTLVRFLTGIGIDDEFVSQVRLIGVTQDDVELEPEIDDKREPECSESSDCDLSAIQTASCIIEEKESMVELPLADDVRVLERDPFAPSASLIKTKMRNNGVVGYTSVQDINGEDAKRLYLSLKDVSGVPIMDGISYAIVARCTSDDATAIADAKVTLDYVLSEDNIAGFELCVAQEAPENRLIWFFGKRKIEDASSTVPLVTPPAVPEFFSIALPDWWSKMAKEPQFKGLPPLRVEEVQRTMRLSEVDLWRYMKTYAPRSWAEAFYLVKTLRREMLDAVSASGHQPSIMDIGCGVGGALLGVLDALAVRVEVQESFKVVAMDGNEKALELLEGFVNARSKSADQCLGSTRDIELTNINKTFAEELQSPISGQFDIILASKSLGEGDSTSFNAFLGYAKERLSQDGVIIIIEVLKHERALNAAIHEAGIDSSVVQHLDVRVGISGEKNSDNEKVVTAIIYKEMLDLRR